MVSELYLKKNSWGGGQICPHPLQNRVNGRHYEKKHNIKVISNIERGGCNCRKNDKCPIDNKCLITSVIYKADNHPIPKVYNGLTEGTFKKKILQTSAVFPRPKLRKKSQTFKVHLEIEGQKERI